MKRAYECHRVIPVAECGMIETYCFTSVREASGRWLTIENIHPTGIIKNSLFYWNFKYPFETGTHYYRRPWLSCAISIRLMSLSSAKWILPSGGGVGLATLCRKMSHIERSRIKWRWAAGKDIHLETHLDPITEQIMMMRQRRCHMGFILISILEERPAEKERVFRWWSFHNNFLIHPSKDELNDSGILIIIIKLSLCLASSIKFNGEYIYTEGMTLNMHAFNPSRSIHLHHHSTRPLDNLI